MSKFIGVVGAFEPEDGIGDLVVFKDMEPEKGEHAPQFIFDLAKIEGATSAESHHLVERMAKTYQDFFNIAQKRRKEIESLKNRSTWHCNYIDLGKGEEYVGTIKMDLHCDLNPIIGQEFLRECAESFVKILKDNGGIDVRIELM